MPQSGWEKVEAFSRDIAVAALDYCLGNGEARARELLDVLRQSA